MPKRPIAGLVVAGLLLVACAGRGAEPAPGAGAAKRGSLLMVAIGVDPDTLDPQAQTTSTSRQLVGMVVEPLVTIDGRGEVQPLLATSWQQAADGLSYRFTLRQGVRFSDGEPLDARAVKLSLDRLRSTTTFQARPGALSVIRDVEVLDDLHVRFHLRSRFAPFVSALAQVNAGIVAPGSLQRAPNTAALIQQPVGTGPYVLRERVPGDRVTVTANPSYWGRPASYDAQTYRIVPDAASREALVKARQVEVAMLPPPQDLPGLEHDSAVRVLLGDSDRSVFISINTQDARVPALQKKAVRQALNYAVDKHAIVRDILFGAGGEATSPSSPALSGACRVGRYPYDPLKARQLLKQAGAEGITVTLGSPRGRYMGDSEIAQAVAGNLRAVGLHVNVPAPPDWVTYASAIAQAPGRQPYDLHVLGSAPSYLDVSGQLRLFQSAYWPPAGGADSYYDSAAVDQLVASANEGREVDQRQRDYCQAQRTIWDDAPWIFLHDQKLPVVTTTRVVGVTMLPNEQFDTVHARPA